MELNDFIEKFAEQFDEPVQIAADTVYADLDEWSSMTSLAVIAMIDDEADVQITSADFRDCPTVSALYERVKSKK